MGLRLGEDDLMLFKYLFEHGFLTVDQIKKWFWFERSNNAVKFRLWKMKEEGFIKRKVDPRGFDERLPNLVLPEEKAYYALEEALSPQDVLSLQNRKRKLPNGDFIKGKIASVAPSLYYIPEDIDLRQFKHDCILVKLRILFENMGAEDWFTDKIIPRVFGKRAFSRIPDALFSFRDKKFALELEMNLKRNRRYAEIFRNYNSEKSIDAVLYVCGDSAIFRSLKKIVLQKNVFGWNKIWLTILNFPLEGSMGFYNPGLQEELWLE